MVASGRVLSDVQHAVEEGVQGGSTMAILMLILMVGAIVYLMMQSTPGAP